MYVCTQHHSNVYGLSIHSGWPWLLASASRDSTLRFWDLRGVAAGRRTPSFTHKICDNDKLCDLDKTTTPIATRGKIACMLMHACVSYMRDSCLANSHLLVFFTLLQVS